MTTRDMEPSVYSPRSTPRPARSSGVAIPVTADANSSAFCARSNANVPDDLDVDLVLDNYATHNAPAIRKRLGSRPRRHAHFTPTASSWVNLVERFFADITEKQIRRGVHRSTAELETAIRASIDAVNDDPKPFRWTKSADDILAAIKRFCLKTLEIASAQIQIARNSESGH